jgi:hypothetical protein
MVRRAPNAIVPPKRVETRNWKTYHRGRLYIHAAKGFPRDAIDTCFLEPFASTLRALGIAKPGDLPRAALIGAVDLQYCEEITPGYLHDIRARSSSEEQARLEFAFGNYDVADERRFAFWCGAAFGFPQPIQCRGALGLWDLPADVAATVAAIDRSESTEKSTSVLAEAGEREA